MGEEGPHLDTTPWTLRRKSLSGSQEGVQSPRFGKKAAGTPTTCTGRRKVSQLFPTSFLPRTGCALVSAFPRRRAGPDGLPRLHLVCSVLPQFPQLAETPGRLLSWGCGQGGRSRQRGLAEEGDWRLGPSFLFSGPGSPCIPSPAWHLSYPDNGTSPGGACAMRPGPSAGVRAGDQGDAGRPGD